jgi:hypothetical protein
MCIPREMAIVHVYHSLAQSDLNLSRGYQGIVKVIELMKNGFVFFLLQSPRVHIERASYMLRVRMNLISWEYTVRR